ncbi:DUF3631 domain-containing protein [Streptomyces longwoodensis]|uniref:DUF3631 domain-containing protein n=1 Tax=Streptomyces longwoodensis TaxID=68231 RepID=UPI0036777571
MTAIDGAALLNEVEAFHRRFNVFPHEAAYVAVVLWDAHAHLLDCFESTPRLAFLSPEPGSGKSRALEIVETLVPNPMAAVDASAAALFRAVAGVDGKRPTILFDEIDTIFGPKAGENEQLRGFINAGHRRNRPMFRCVGDGANQTVQAFHSYAAVAVAGLGYLPDTIRDRSVNIRMRRRARNETIEPYRTRIHEKEGFALRDRLATWAEQVSERVMNVWPAMPEGVTDRPADVWEPLLAVADAAGDWPGRAREACVVLVAASKANDKGSLGVRLLTDLRDHVMTGIDRLPTVAILDRLNALDDAPWADLHGKPLDNRRLSRMLAEYMTADNEPIASRNIKAAGSVLKGYYAADLRDAWARYCPPPPESPLPPLPGTENAA